MQLIRIPNEKSHKLHFVLKKIAEYLIAAAVAIVGGGEDGHHISIMRPVVALHHQLVSPEMLPMIFSSNPTCYCLKASYRVTKVSPFEWLKVSDMS